MEIPCENPMGRDLTCCRSSLVADTVSPLEGEAEDLANLARDQGMSSGNHSHPSGIASQAVGSSEGLGV